MRSEYQVTFVASSSPGCSRRIRDTRDLLDQAGHNIGPAPQPLATLDDLYNLVRAAGITIPTRTTTAS